MVRFHKAALAQANFQRKGDLRMQNESGIWLQDINLTRPIVKNGNNLSGRVSESWVHQHTNRPIAKGELVVIGSIQSSRDLSHLLVIKVTSIEPKADGSLVFNGIRVPNVPKNLI